MSLCSCIVSDSVGREEALDLEPPRLAVVEQPAPRVLQGRIGGGEVGDEVLVGVVEEQVVVDELVARDDAEEVDEALGGGADDGAHVVAADVGFEDGEVDVGVGVGGVVEAAARHGVGGAPEAEDAVDVEEVGEEGAVLVPALAGAGGPQHGGQLGERRVHLLLLTAQEGARRVQRGGEVRRRRHNTWLARCGSERSERVIDRVKWRLASCAR
uniref:DUF834 domain-containing protein n=1 Tax=Oryza meridionalis TaxID=40149 RepID=A0A0E0CTF6_9ORYZ